MSKSDPALDAGFGSFFATTAYLHLASGCFVGWAFPPKLHALALHS